VWSRTRREEGGDVAREAPPNLIQEVTTKRDLPGFRRTIFAVGLLFWAAAAILSRVVVPASPFDRVVSPVLAAGCVVTAIAVMRRPRVPQIVEWALPAVATAYVAVRIADILLSTPTPQDLAVETALFAPWGPIILIMAWLLLPRDPALRLTITGYYGALLLPVAVYAASGNATPVALGMIGSLVLASGAVTVLLGSLIRLRELQARTQALREASDQWARTDALTGLPNRRSLTEELIREIARARRHRWPLTIILFDLDRFRDVNARYGYRTGNDILVAVATQVNDHVRDTDPFGRWKDEEFLLVAPEANGNHGALIAERIRGVLEHARFPVAGVKPTASFGGAVLNDEDTWTSLVARAATALLHAKSQGGNRVAFD